eukprot:TRINITY_DN4022_c0_g1_i2.p2 TRINITY_DN4022_c0_g1~~TRINITY_DN4022_c0_g1_i2.p2  ORF type:complete len:128 (-),score=33.82 TRINITY_DN4022_c0_g1_i2:458-841(-)
MLRSLVGSEMCIRDRYQRRVRGSRMAKMRAWILVLVAAMAADGFEYRVASSQIPGTMFQASCDQVHQGCKHLCPDQAIACDQTDVCDWCSPDSTLRCMLQPPAGCASDPSRPWGPHLPNQVPATDSL